MHNSIGLFLSGDLVFSVILFDINSSSLSFYHVLCLAFLIAFFCVKIYPYFIIFSSITCYAIQ